jgi:hypothetical protein
MIKKITYFFHKVIHWEYWPQYVLYAPIFPVYLYYAFKCKTLYFPIAANPTMENGGYLMESKNTIYKQLPQHLVPKTIFIGTGECADKALAKMNNEHIGFPCICKPDIGGKGLGVAIVQNIEELYSYHNKVKVNYLIQEKLPFKEEVGVFYCRYANEQNGFITGIVGKKDMQIIGDGKSSIQQLIEAVPRFYFQRKFLFEKFETSLNSVLPKGEILVLLTIGNHSRGSEFMDLSMYNNKQLEKVIDKISKAYNTFYYGRYDIMFDSWEDLYAGKNFSIIELNGSGSEPTHLYDAKHSLLKAWKIIIQHWKIAYKIAVQQHQNKIEFTPNKIGNKITKEYALYEKMVKENLSF